MIIVAFALPLKKVEGKAMDKIKKIDGWGCSISFLASIAILLPISWYVSSPFSSPYALSINAVTGLAHVTHGHQLLSYRHLLSE